MSTRRPRTPPDRSARVEEQMSFENVTAALGYVPGVGATGATIAYVDAKIVDSIADADTTRAPSRNAVFDALAGKETAGAAAAAQAAAQAFATAADTALLTAAITNGDTTHAPSGDAVFDALALKQPLDAELTSLAALSLTAATLRVVRENAAGNGFEMAAASGGSTPTGTGFTHVTAGVQDAAAKLVDTADINADQVTYAKMQNVSATSRILGRKTAAAGDTEECTLSEVLDFIGSAAQGDILFRGASGWQRLGTGSSGQLLKSQGAAADLVWASVAGVTGGVSFLATATVTGAAATTLTMSGLDLSAYKGFIVWGALDNATASQSNISLYYNSDTTSTNYWRVLVSGVAAAISGARNNDSIVIVLQPSECTNFQANIHNDRDSKPRARVFGAEGAPSGLIFRDASHIWNSATNVTGITLSASVANSLAIGSHFSVWGIN